MACVVSKVELYFGDVSLLYEVDNNHALPTCVGRYWLILTVPFLEFDRVSMMPLWLTRLEVGFGCGTEKLLSVVFVSLLGVFIC